MSATALRLSMTKEVVVKRVVIAVALAVAAGSIVVPSPRLTAHAQDAPAVREIEIIVRGRYQPSRITVREGEPVRLRFVRQEYASCSREVVFPWLGLRRELPPNQPVVIELPAMEAGEHEFRCGMNMLRGTIVVQPASDAPREGSPGPH